MWQFWSIEENTFLLHAFAAAIQCPHHWFVQVCLYWTDLDTRDPNPLPSPLTSTGGVRVDRVYYRVTADSTDTAFGVVTANVPKVDPLATSFNASVVVVYTLLRARHYSRTQYDEGVTAQLILATDGESAAIRSTLFCVRESMTTRLTLLGSIRRL